MKKKVLSVVLASALFAGGAVAASAQVWGDWDSSSKSGENADITDLAFTEASYTIRNGADPKNMLEVLTAYAGDNKIVQEPDLEWEISDNDLIFELNTEDNGATVAAYENSGSATITVTANEGKVKATCKVVAAPLIKATGFKFEKSSYALPTGMGLNAEGYDLEDKAQTYTVDQTVKLVATPNDSALSDNQKQAFSKMRIALVVTKKVEDKSGNVLGDGAYDIDKVIAVSNTGNKDGEFVFPADTAERAADHALLKEVYSGVTNARLVVIEGDVAEGTKITDKSVDTKVNFPAYDSDKSPKDISRDVRASTTLAKAATRAGRTGSITIEVGQSVKPGDFVKYGPTNANVGKGGNGTLSKWAIDYYNAAATEDDFAVLNNDADKIMGIAVGRVKAVATFTPLGNGDPIEIEIPINVVARGAKADAPATTEPTTESATLAIGGTYWVESGDANTTWTVDNDNVTILPEVGAGCKVFAKKAGTATVTGKVGDKVVKTVTITIEAAGATTPDVPAEANPSTGDSLLAFLF